MSASVSLSSTAALFAQKYAAYYNNIEYCHLSGRNNEIRLLRIQPAANPDERIVCDLEYASLNHPCHNYVALSYQWGDSLGGEHVILAGNYVAVTSNLYSALWELRSRGHFLVWADGLCINQADLEERSQQVLRMAAIYRFASLVVSYLDCREPLVRVWSDVVSELNRYIRQKFGDEFKYSQSKDKNIKKRRKHGTGHLDKHATAGEASRGMNISMFEPHCGAFKLLLNHAYWTRAWIIQEISVNPHHEIIWGDNIFKFDELVVTLRTLAHVNGIGDSRAQHHIEQLWRIRQSRLALQPLALVDALKICRQAQASIYQDRIFALLGLTHDGNSLVPQPSYEVPMDSLSYAMTLRMIQATGNLDLVVTKAHEVKSWFPDWFNPQSWAPPSRGPAGMPDLVRPGCIGPSYRASRNCRAVIGPSRGHMSISLKGLCVGQVTACSPTLEEAKASRLDRSHITIPRTWGDPGKGKTPPCAKNTAVTESLRWLLVNITGNYRNNHNSTANGRNSFGLLWRLLHRRESLIHDSAPDLIQWMNCCEKQGFQINDEPFVSYFSQRNEKGRAAPSAFPSICQTIQWNLKAGMRLDSLSGGQLGWLHKNANVGDKVVVFLGSSMPCVIRSSCNGFFTIEGPCIINGVMNGEALKGTADRLKYFSLL
ncbi:heterokaryon incompatibility protein-domain-containing protein [Xylaria sp. FL0064]|nr:heterokaryon incompatibility protein-domain-containing protein [Xylaria sp. FL0064]